jgi:hypothetical protein
LDAVETYVNTNKHLPNVPSGQEMLKNGVSVGEMNMKLLEKVEELTLYMIDLNKQNQELKNDNQALKSRVEALENK